MTATTDRDKRAEQALKYLTQAATTLGQAVKTLKNDPQKIDNSLLRVIVYVLLIPIGVIFRRNLLPYATFMAAMVGSDSPGVGAKIAGTAAFAAVQYFEVFPQLLPPNAPNDRRAARMWLSAPAYIVDIIACWTFWPPIKAGSPEGIMLVRFIDWGNLFMTLVTVFGLAVWFWLRKRARRAA